MDRSATESKASDGAQKSRRRVQKDLEAIFSGLEGICKVRASRQKLAERQDRSSAQFQKETKLLESGYKEVHANVARVKREVMMVPQPQRFADSLRSILSDVSDLSNKKHDNDRHTCAAITLGNLKRLKEKIETLALEEEDEAEAEGQAQEEDSLSVLTKSSSRALPQRSAAPSRGSVGSSATRKSSQRKLNDEGKGPQLLDCLEDLTELKSVLEKLLASISRIIDCKQNLRKVKTAQYMTKYENTLATESTVKEQQIQLLESLASRFPPSSEHVQLINVICTAAATDDGALDVLLALKTDISAHIVKLSSFIRKESTSRYGRLPSASTRGATAASVSVKKQERDPARPVSKGSHSSSGSLRSAGQQLIRSTSTARSVDSLGTLGEPEDNQVDALASGMAIDLSLVGSSSRQ